MIRFTVCAIACLALFSTGHMQSMQGMSFKDALLSKMSPKTSRRPKTVLQEIAAASESEGYKNELERNQKLVSLYSELVDHQGLRQSCKDYSTYCEMHQKYSAEVARLQEMEKANKAEAEFEERLDNLLSCDITQLLEENDLSYQRASVIEYIPICQQMYAIASGAPKARYEVQLSKLRKLELRGQLCSQIDESKRENDTRSLIVTLGALLNTYGDLDINKGLYLATIEELTNQADQEDKERQEALQSALVQIELQEKEQAREQARAVKRATQAAEVEQKIVDAQQAKYKTEYEKWDKLAGLTKQLATVTNNPDFHEHAKRYRMQAYATAPAHLKDVNFRALQ